MRLQIAGGKEREKEARLNLASIHIQRLARGFIGRRVAGDRREFKYSVKLQQFARAHFARKELRLRQHNYLLNSCATAIQAELRRFSRRLWFSSFLRKSLPFSHGSWENACAALKYQRNVKNRYAKNPDKISNLCEVGAHAEDL